MNPSWIRYHSATTGTPQTSFYSLFPASLYFLFKSSQFFKATSDPSSCAHPSQTTVSGDHLSLKCLLLCLLMIKLPMAVFLLLCWTINVYRLTFLLCLSSKLVVALEKCPCLVYLLSTKWHFSSRAHSRSRGCAYWWCWWTRLASSLSILRYIWKDSLSCHLLSLIAFVKHLVPTSLWYMPFRYFWRPQLLNYIRMKFWWFVFKDPFVK